MSSEIMPRHVKRDMPDAAHLLQFAEMRTHARKRRKAEYMLFSPFVPVTLHDLPGNVQQAYIALRTGLAALDTDPYVAVLVRREMFVR